MKQCMVCGEIITNEYQTNCPVCNAPSIKFKEATDRDILSDISSDESFIEAMLSLKEKDPIEYQLKLKQFEIQKEQREEVERQREEAEAIACPRCGSTSVDVTTRGFSFFTGFLGSGEPRNVCKKCGYKWKPKM